MEKPVIQTQGVLELRDPRSWNLEASFDILDFRNICQGTCSSFTAKVVISEAVSGLVAKSQAMRSPLCLIAKLGERLFLGHDAYLTGFSTDDEWQTLDLMLTCVESEMF